MVTRLVQVDFKCLADCALPLFEKEPADEDVPIYVWLNAAGERRWEPRLSPKVFVQMDDLCPSVELKSHEYRVYNEQLIRQALRRVVGDGILTVVCRKYWPWHFGLAWSRSPLLPAQAMINEAPSWWQAEDLWQEVESFEALDRRVSRQNAINNVARTAVEQARAELGRAATAEQVRERALAILEQA